MKSRAEAFGAWVRLDEPPALVAVDRVLARRLGVDGAAAWGDVAPISMPLEVHLAVTSRCAAGCTGCYLDARPDGDAVPFATLAERIDAIAAGGVFTVAFGGGEPLSHPDLPRLAEHARARGLSPVTTTSGIGLTEARARDLLAFDQINVSYDGEGEAYRAVRGFDGARVAERAMTLLAAAGVPFGINLVLTRATFGDVEATVARAVALGAREVQLLRYKPAGRARSLAYLETRLAAEQVERVPEVIERLVARGDVRVRIDCAMVPFLAPAVTDPARLEQLGVFGCEAGRHLAAGRVDGMLAACSFAEASATPIVDLSSSWTDDASAAAFRAHADDLPEPCASCPVRAVCRGGCRVVAAHLGSERSPDPECPRVRAHRGEHDVT
jgi:radical SAM protein with 4Fe4S-binding SPASM domain